MTRKNRKKKKNAPAPSGSTRVWSAVLLAALAAIIGLVLAVLESVKEAAL